MEPMLLPLMDAAIVVGFTPDEARIKRVQIPDRKHADEERKRPAAVRP
jgi:hypothetical protein